MQGRHGDWPAIGVVVVTYGAEDFIADCLHSLAASAYPDLRIVVVDNASPDATPAAVRAWARGDRPFRPRADWPLPPPAPLTGALPFAEQGPGAAAPATAGVTLVCMEANRGFAGGVNAGLRLLAGDPGLGLFWVLNPDTVVAPETPFALARRAREMGRFAVIGGRVLYLEAPERVQSDGGRLHRLAASAVGVNFGAPATAALPDAAGLDYIPGMSMLASREFLDRAGMLDEGWFLYFEEIDWQLRRGDLALGLAPGAVVYHRAGASIGSGRPGERAGAFALYFACRNLMRFARRRGLWHLPFAYAISWIKLVRHFGAARPLAVATFRGLHGLGPPRAVRARLPEEVWARVLRRGG